MRALIAPFQHLSLPPELFRHFFIKTGGQASALDVWLQRSRSCTMSRLHNCSTHTISLIRKLLVHVIRDAFYVRFGFRCPQHLQRIRDLSLLPHILHTNRCWMDLSLGEVASLFDLSENDFELCLHQPNRLDKWEGAIRIANPIGTAIIDYRLKSNGSLPTRMRTLFSWNINSWRTFLIPRITSYEDVNGFLGRVQSACKRQSGQAGRVSTSISKIPGVRVYHSAAVRCGERSRTGGVAILLPPGWVALEELELVPGRAIAVRVQDRACQFFLVSVYIHPEHRKQDAEALMRAWRMLDRDNHDVFLAGDFNGVDTHFADTWQQIFITI